MPEVVSKIRGRFPQTMHFRDKPRKRGLAGGSVGFPVVAGVDPMIQGLVERIQGSSGKAGKQSGPDGFKPSFDFAFFM